MASLNLNLEPTQRGFVRADFNDLYGAWCSIQESSLATDDAIWLGLDEGTHHHVTGECMARMHLSRDQVAELIPVLQYFVENGHLPSGERPNKGLEPTP